MTDLREIDLSEGDAQAVLLVRAVEEEDRTGELLPLAERRRVTAHARGEDGGGDPARWLASRARELSGVLARELPSLPRFLRFTSPVRGLTGPAVAVAFVLGVATNALGPERRINVLAAPLLGLIAWNLTVLAVLAVRSWLPVSAAVHRVPRFVGRLETMARRLIDRWPQRAERHEQVADVRQALGQYLSWWLPAVTPLAAARGRRLLHGMSLALILGVVVGMYLRGVAFQYQATWESTFLSGATVDHLLGTVLAPAAGLLATEVPKAAAIEGPDYGDAAPWIHLWAVTAVLFVGLPRAALLAFEGVRCGRYRRRLTVRLPDSYVRRLLASVDTSEHRLEVLPYSYRPSASAVDSLKRLLYDVFGPRSEIRLGSPVEYGAEPSDLEPGGARLRIVLFGLAQTPEVEVHGELLQRLLEDLPDGQSLAVVVDASAYRQRLENVAGLEDRLLERQRAWNLVVRDCGLQAVQVDLSQPLPEEALSRLVAAAWPAGSIAGGT